MVARANNQRHRLELNVEFLDLPGERIPLPDAIVDTVVSTFTLCTIPGIADAIRGIARVLRPGGQFLFFEHGLSPDVRVRRWQERTEPLSCTYKGRRVRNRTNGDGVLGFIPEVRIVLLLGRCSSEIVRPPIN